MWPRPKPARDGVVIYAGGDDLLALLPLDTVIEAAIELETKYRGCFDEAFRLANGPTTSASIVFADHHEPLRGVLHESHRRLEEVAKDKNRRNSIAVSVMKPSGSRIEWVQAWLHEDRSLPRAVLDLIPGIEKDDISARFGYTLDRRFLAAFGDRFRDLELSADELRDVLRSTLGKRREDDPARERDVRRIVEDLLRIGTPHPGDGSTPPEAGAAFSVQGLRLAFFLAGRDGAEGR